MAKGALKVRIPNPHKGDISKHLVSEILRQAGIPVKEWNQLDGK
jgi:ABC-type phosphate transport system substrate-binding protein